MGISIKKATNEVVRAKRQSKQPFARKSAPGKYFLTRGICEIKKTINQKKENTQTVQGDLHM
jgi:hypothetical protein